MFDFENLIVYQKAKCFNQQIRLGLHTKLPLDRVSEHQLRRSALSILLNIAEGSGRFTKLDKRRFFVMSRGSVFETAAILELLYEDKLISQVQYDRFYSMSDELSRMLYSMIRKLEK